MTKEKKVGASAFEQICRESRLEPVKKIKVGHRIVLIADGYKQDHPDFRGPHHQTVWAVGKDEDNLEVARPLYFSVLNLTSKETRVAAAEQDGKDFAEEMNARSIP